MELGILRQWYKDKPALNAVGTIIDFPDAINKSTLLNLKQQPNRK